MNEEEKLQLENECLLKYSKAQMIQKYIDELEENCTLSNLWCKSQEENKRLNNIINKLENFICDLEYECISDTPMWRFAVIIHNKLKELKAQEEITMAWYDKVKKIKDFLNGYEENRNSFKWTEQDYIDTIEEIKDIVGSDKE